MSISLKDIVKYDEINKTPLSKELIEQDLEMFINLSGDDAKMFINEGLINMLKKIGNGIKNLFKEKDPKKIGKTWSDQAKDLKAKDLTSIITDLGKKYKCSPEQIKTVLSKVDPSDENQMKKIAKQLKISDDQIEDFANKLGIIQNADPNELKKAQIKVFKNPDTKTDKQEAEEASALKPVQDSFKAHKAAIVALCQKTQIMPSQYAGKTLEVCEKAGIDIEKNADGTLVYAMTLMVIGASLTKGIKNAKTNVPIFMAMCTKIKPE